MNILKMGREELLLLDPGSVNKKLSEEEVLHIFSVFGGFWQYDYETEAKNGKVLPYHAQLKAKDRCSDKFLYSKAVLSHPNLCLLFAKQMVKFYLTWQLPKPDYVAGIPNGATELGKCFAEIIGAKVAEMKKDDGKIKMVSLLDSGVTLLFVEDMCTHGTGLKEAAAAVKAANSAVKILPYEPVIVNRGGLKDIEEKNENLYFIIVPVATHRINDWARSQCQFCKAGSIPISPKASDENWEKINSQFQK